MKPSREYNGFHGCDCLKLITVPPCQGPGILWDSCTWVHSVLLHEHSIVVHVERRWTLDRLVCKILVQLSRVQTTDPHYHGEHPG